MPERVSGSPSSGCTPGSAPGPETGPSRAESEPAAARSSEGAAKSASSPQALGKESLSLFQIFWIIFKINLLTFGGGYTIAPILDEAFARKRACISKEDMLNIIALAQSGPGAMAVSASFLCGYRISGAKGAFVAGFASVLPPLLVITLVSYFYRAFASNLWIRAALRGMGGVVAAYLFVSVWRLGRVCFQTSRAFAMLSALAAFGLAVFTPIPIPLIIVMAALAGLIYFSILERRRGGKK